MQKLISKYGLAAHLALVVVAPLFLPASTVLWLAALAFIWVLMEPSRVGDEMLHNARERVRHAILVSPLTWVLVVGVLFAGIRCLNTGVALAYDAEQLRWFVSKPAAPLLPGSVDGRGFAEFAGSVAVLVGVLGARTALGRSARHGFIFCASVLSGGYAAFIVAARLLSPQLAATPIEATLDGPVMPGSLFGVFCSVGLCALYQTFGHRWFRAMPFTVLAISGNAAGLFLFSPPEVVVLFTAAFVLTYLYIFVYARKALSAGSEFRLTVLLGMELTLAVVLVMTALSEKDLAAKLAPFLSGDFLSDAMMARRAALSEVALRIWKTSPWLGCGLGVFPIELNFLANADDWKVIPALQQTPLNGYWLLLIERGTVGAFILAAPLVMMLIHYGMKLVQGVRLQLPDPTSWVGLVLLVVSVVEGLLTASLLSPAMLVALAVCLTLSANSFPKKKVR